MRKPRKNTNPSGASSATHPSWGHADSAGRRIELEEERLDFGHRRHDPSRDAAENEPQQHVIVDAEHVGAKTHIKSGGIGPAPTPNPIVVLSHNGDSPKFSDPERIVANIGLRHGNIKA